MSTSARYAEQLTVWYENTARPLLAKVMPDRVPQLDSEFERLRAMRTGLEQELPVCFLGNAGVGKSTLLNALVAGHVPILPAGGVGPLTAQATLVRHAAEPFFRATYLPPQRLNKVLFALERYHELELKRQGAAVAAAAQTAVAEADLTEEDKLDVETSLPAQGEPQEGGDVSEKIAGYRKQAALLIYGDQLAPADTPYLLDCLRQCLRRERIWGTTLLPEHTEHIERIQRALAIGRSGTSSFEKKADGDLPGFLRELGMHASGHLAPLIKTLDVGWGADFLQGGLVLVDLPGLGVANDEYRSVTANWIRKARAIALIVDRSGVTQASADLLHSTGFLTSLLHDIHDPDAEPVSLIVVMVKLDLVADEERNREKAMQGSARPFVAHFEQACERSKSLIHGQLDQELQRIMSAGSETTREDRRQAIAKMLSTLQVHPVAATEYRKVVADDEDDRPRLKTREASGVPGLAIALEQIVLQRADRIDAAIESRARGLYDRGRGSLELIITEWQSEARAHDEAERLRADLEQYVAPLRNEFLGRQGAYREFLRRSLPELIEAKVDAAAASAQDDIERLLTRKYSEYHWATLRAAVRNGGRFDGARYVDLPNELTLAFEEPIAIVWSKEILSLLRKRTSEFGGDYVDMVGQVSGWAREQGTRVKPELIDALHKDLKAQTKGLGTVGKEAIEELKENVKTELFDKVIDQVRKRCQRFVDEKRHEGPGVKQRIIQFMSNDLAAAVVEVARPAAKRVLKKNYSAVNEEISEVLGKYKNPVDASVESIIGSEELRLRRSDAQRRRAVLAEVNAILAALPEPPGPRE